MRLVVHFDSFFQESEQMMLLSPYSLLALPCSMLMVLSGMRLKYWENLLVNGAPSVIYKKQDKLRYGLWRLCLLRDIGLKKGVVFEHVEDMHDIPLDIQVALSNI